MTKSKSGLGALKSTTADLAGLPDERLVDEALAGDRDAFGALVLRHQRGLVNYIFRLVGSRDLAMDLAQEVFMKVYVSLDSFDPRYRFTTWLYRIASNSSIDQLRRKQPRTLSLSGPSAEEDAAAPTLAGSDPTPDDMLRLRELEARLDAAITELPVSYRQLILLRHRQHCRYDEIARITRLPLGTVKNRIFRAREILRAQLSDLLDAEVTS
ncbi:MAG TPA: sigma-70 family RNA polymerase sigma factor [Candidatus Polarisedimenticolaceae bacterium]|nr:sigma-70 family RNA polymerase sigma factor [Candidatus Polarisedimenticolaceae bacterium]